MLVYNPKLKKLSRELRKNSTEPEKILWQYLRRNQIYGLKFSRQKPVGEYILDFYCHKIKLAIELDGDQHFYKIGRDKDKEKDKALEEMGIKILRFPNNEIYRNKNAVLDKIYMVAKERQKKLKTSLALL